MRPRVPLLHDQPVSVEEEKRRARQGLLGSVPRRDERPPVDRRTHSVDHGLAEPALRGCLIGERPRDVFGRCLAITERVGVEDRVVRVQRSNRVEIGDRPGPFPDRGPAGRGSPSVYFATSMARLSRMTITFTWPGYSS